MWTPNGSESVGVMTSAESVLNSSPSKWEIAFKAPGLLVAHIETSGNASRRTYPLTNQAGVILGVLFHRSDGHAARWVTQLGENETRQILKTNGEHLVSAYWGSYVAVVYEPLRNRRSIFRDPSGNFPCYYTRFRGVNVFFSHVEDCIEVVPVSITINWKHITAYLIANETLTRECGFREVEDVPGGECITLCNGTVSRAVLWHPSRFCREPRFDSEESAAQLLRLTVQSAVDAWSSRYKNIVLRLSGGLDSSIVAGSLAQAPSRPRVTCLNFFPESTAADVPVISPTLSNEDRKKERRLVGHADEREYAKLVAQRWGFPLIERERRVRDVNMARIWDAPVALRPSQYNCNFDMDDAEIQIARERGADAFFSGLAGDAVFYCTLRAVGAIDYAYFHPFNLRLLGELFNTATLSGESVWRVLTKVLTHGYMRRPMPWRNDSVKRPHLLSSDAVGSIQREDFEHPWLKLAQQLPGGKYYHVCNVASPGFLFYPYVFHRGRFADAINPLTAQPVVELCLQIPTYILLAGGISRGLARRAFSDILPPQVRRRTVKGSAATFWHQVLRHNTRFVRESLMDGQLVKQGMLDRNKAADYLTDNQRFLTVDPGQIMSYLSAEAWLRQWTLMRHSAPA